MQFFKRMLKLMRVDNWIIIIPIVFVFFMATVFACGKYMEADQVPTPSTEYHTSVLENQSPDIDFKSSKKPAEAQGEINVAKNPYSDWRSWCEPVNHKECKVDDDCLDVEHPSSRPLTCVNPWWAKGEEYKVCTAGFSRKSEREWRYNRLREIVRQNYFDEVKYCKNDGRPVHKEHWRCQKEWKKADDLTKFLWIVYQRETSGRPWKRHRLEADTKANKTSWYKQSKRYGWEVKINKHGDIQKVEKISEHANPYYSKHERWKYGLGPYGHNAALFSAAWDVYAPPEILCKEVEPTEVYLRRARKVIRDLANGIDCNGDKKRDHWDKSPTLTVIHRGASGGKVCPKNTPSHIKHQENFKKRAQKADLDPDQVWTLEMLGKPMEAKTQNVKASEIYSHLDKVLPSP